MQTAKILLILTLSLSACTTVTGSFCDVAQDLRQDRALAEYIFDADEVLARRLAAHNALRAECG